MRVITSSVSIVVGVMAMTQAPVNPDIPVTPLALLLTVGLVVINVVIVLDSILDNLLDHRLEHHKGGE
jgi:hypothetical protein